MQPQVFKLKNGLRVILIDTKAFPTMTAIMLFGAGSRYEDRKNNGIAHFLEHMVFKGSKKYPDFFTISSVLESLGATHNAFTGKDHTGFWVKAPTEHFEKIIDVIADILQNPLLKEEEIVREKNVIVQEMNMYEDNPMRRVGEHFEQLLYPNHSLGMDIIGTKETVSSFKRQNFVEYMQRFYQPENAVLVIAGGLSQYQKLKIKNQNDRSNIKYFLSRIEDKFAKFEAGNPEGSQARFLQVLEKQTKPGMRIVNKKTEQTHFTLGYRTFPFTDPRRYVLAVLGTILGGGSSSRLFIEVRERRGLCYYIHTGKEHYHDVGYVATQAGVNNNLDIIKKAIETIIKEQEKVAKGEVKKEEVDRAKQIIKGRILLSMEDSANVASWYGAKQIREGKAETVEEVIDRILAVKEEEIVELAKEIFRKEKMNLSLIGPFEERDFQGFVELNSNDKIQITNQNQNPKFKKN